MQAGTDKAVEFLQQLYPQGLWVLTAIQTDRKAISTKSFTDAEKARKWIEQYNGKRNIYFQVNQPTELLTKKAEKADINAAYYLHVDIDCRAGEEVSGELERIKNLLGEGWPEGIPRPTITVFSGGGYQCFWKLDKAVEIGGDLEAAQEFERYNKALELTLGGDHCHNCDRIMRLPGTLNIPDAKKIKKGRQTVQAELIEFNDNVISLEQLTPVPKVKDAALNWTESGPRPKVELSGDVTRLQNIDELDEWAVPDRIKIMIVQGIDPDDEGRHGSRSERLFDVICNLLRAQVPDDTIFNIVTDPDFLISEHVLAQKTHTGRYAVRQIERAKEEVIEPMLRIINQEYAVIKDYGGYTRVLREYFDPVMNWHKVSYLPFQSFKEGWCNKFVTITKNEKPVHVPAGKWWLEHPMRREYQRVEFVPGKEQEGVYNLWRGFAVEARKGDCSLFLEHVRNNVCGGNGEHYEYLMDWLARAVQAPGEPAGSAIVLHGGQGTGKSFFVNAIGKLFGRHYSPVASDRYITGQFNIHLQDCVLLFADEALYAGDKKHEATLKQLITEPQLRYESKGVNTLTGRNCIHLIMASNDDWVVPAGMDDRRFFVLEVGDERVGDYAYFSAIDTQLENGGYGALLHELMNRNLFEYDYRNVPKTEALKDQKLESLSPIEDWMYSKLYDGRVLKSQEKWIRQVPTETLVVDYVEYARDFGIGRRVLKSKIGRFLHKLFKDTSLSKIQRMIEETTWLENGMQKTERKLTWCYRLPTLEDCRDAWDKMYKMKVDWPAEKPEQAELDKADDNVIPF